MNLTFGICWIEDQASEVEIAAVEAAVRVSGFEPDIERIEDVEEIRKFAQRQEYFQDFDLILLDLRLGPGLQADDIAPDIRRRFRSTPILFYSADAEQKLRGLMADKGVEGVYCAHRERLSARVGELVADLSPALNRLSGMRGLASGVVAECDQEFREILRCLARSEISEGALVASIKGRVYESIANANAQIDAIDDLEGLLFSRSVSSVILSREVFHHLKGLDVSDAVRVKRYALRQYEETVLGGRNVLAHGLEERTDDGWRIVRPGPKPDLTVQDFQAYRSDFLAHLRDVRELRHLLIGEETD